MVGFNPSQKIHSTRSWYEFFQQRDETHENVLNSIASSEHRRQEEIRRGRRSPTYYHDRHRETTIRPKGDFASPINILVLDGGGLKGYALMAMIEEIEKISGNRDFLGRFDLVGGTSAGGIGSLIINQSTHTNDAIAEGIHITDAIKERSFEKLSLVKLIMDGNAAGIGNQPSDTFRKRYGNRPLYNPGGIKAFAVSAIRKGDGGKEGNNENVEPFLLRTYDNENGIAGTHNLKYWEAIAGTSAAPVVFDRVRTEVGGKRVSLADGGLIANSPVGLAVSEACSIWQKRPLGVILSLGLSKDQDSFSYRAIDIYRPKNCNTLHFQRIMCDAVAEFSFSTVDSQKIKGMEEEVRRYIREDPSVRLQLDHTIKMLFQSPKRRINQNNISKRQHATLYQEDSFTTSEESGSFSSSTGDDQFVLCSSSIGTATETVSYETSNCANEEADENSTCLSGGIFSLFAALLMKN